MKPLLTTACALLLSACAATPAPSVSSANLPIAITRLTPSVAPGNGPLEVSITVRNDFARTLKTVRVFVAAYADDGRKVSTADESIEILGPVQPGQSIGPLEKITNVEDRSAHCVEVVRVEAVMMDYATRIASGSEARALVTDSAHARCGHGAVATR